MEGDNGELRDSACINTTIATKSHIYTHLVARGERAWGAFTLADAKLQGLDRVEHGLAVFEQDLGRRETGRTFTLKTRSKDE